MIIAYAWVYFIIKKRNEKKVMKQIPCTLISIPCYQIEKEYKIQKLVFMVIKRRQKLVVYRSQNWKWSSYAFHISVY